jgi:4'-phosphopantetheinyl transferase
MPVEMRVRGFFDCWTREESFIKATGERLHLPLDSFQVAFRRGEPPGLRLRTGAHVYDWSMFDVSPSDEYSGALAVRGSGWKLRSWTTLEDWV